MSSGFRSSRGRALASVCAVVFLTFLDTTIVSVALGSVQSDLHAGVAGLQWVVSAYALVFAALLLTGGSLGDRFGRKKLMLGGVAVFAVGSLLGALAPNVGVLIAARAIMGIGAAASEPGRSRCCGISIPTSGSGHARRRSGRRSPGWRSRAGRCSAAQSSAAAGWRGVFWFNVAFAAVLLLVTSRFVPESADPEQARLDLPGFLLGGLAVGAATFAIIEGETSGYTTAWVDVLFAVAAVASGRLRPRRVEGSLADARPALLPSAGLQQFAGRRLRRLLRDLLDLLLHGAVPGGGGRLFRISRRRRVRADGRGSDRRLLARRPLGRTARRAPTDDDGLLRRGFRDPADPPLPADSPELLAAHVEPRGRRARLRDRDRPGHRRGSRARTGRALRDGRVGERTRAGSSEPSSVSPFSARSSTPT